ncbi:MAG TPA: FAD-binding oxidoreductase [Gammaproteobacteria bacterium]|nr:FAD-binding oxidoreductase [Gammaproteobacteria bacterium]
MSHEKFKFVLQSSRMVTPRVRQLSFKRADGAPFTYVPGQFITLHLPWEAMELRRSYSIATIPGSADEIQIAATFVEDGRATRLLYGMLPGAEVDATGPFGRFVLRDDPPARYLLIATGTGVSPYRAMLPQLRKLLGDGTHEVVLMLGVRGPDELLFGEDFLGLAREFPKFHFVGSYSRRLSAPPLAHERQGYVQDHLMEFEPQAGRDIVYLCGNPDMIDASVERLKAIGFDNHSLRREKYVSSN